MKLIPLTQGQFAIVSDHWFDYLNRWKWTAHWDKHTKSFYAIRKEGRPPHQKEIAMHRVIAKTPDGMLCDHIYHNTLDNREEKLRNVTYSQNAINQRIRSDNTTGRAGVRLRKESGRYRVRLRSKGKSIFDKTFKTFDEAVRARKEAEQKYFGEFAYQEEVS